MQVICWANVVEELLPRQGWWVEMEMVGNPARFWDWSSGKGRISFVHCT